MNALGARAWAVAAALLVVVGHAHPLIADEDDSDDRTPPRLSFTEGEVSFWRPGVEEWTTAQINIPLAPGDALYAAAGGSFEVQIGPRAFVRAGADTQLRIEDQTSGFLQLEVTAGRVSLDLRSLKSGHAVELNTPNAAFMIESSGYYRVDVSGESTAFATRRGGLATVRPAGGAPTTVAAGDAVVVTGAERPWVQLAAAPELDEWDGWNYGRSDQLLDSASARYVPEDVYGTAELDRYGSWRDTADYGPVWIPARVAPDWAPYSDGRWLWDRYYGWSWVDAAPWGWAPGHYGRWVQTRGYWGWAPGPLVVAPVYAPALVAFFGGPHLGVSIGIGTPAVGWVALGWGEPLVPWWGRRGYAGVPCWRGWGGPRVINNVVIRHDTVINVGHIHNYRNVHVKNAVIAVPVDRFARGGAERYRVRGGHPRRLEPLHGRNPVQPASLAPAQGRGARPPQDVRRRSRADAGPPQVERNELENRRGAAPAGRRPSSSSTIAVPRQPGTPVDRRERARPPRPPQSSARNPVQQPRVQSGQADALRQPRTRPEAGRGSPALPQARVREPRHQMPAMAPRRLAPQAAPPERPVRLPQTDARVREPRHQMPAMAPRQWAPQAAAPPERPVRLPQAELRVREPRHQMPVTAPRQRAPQAAAPVPRMAQPRERQFTMSNPRPPRAAEGGDSSRRRAR